MKISNLEFGIYKHYKGKKYEVLGVGKHTETEEDVVIYRPLYESGVSYWVRPYAMFIDTVTVDDKTVPRFKKVEK
ncbi:MAG TPA: DUF1653 domain-containing protein [Candidatus Saccharimonadales bacterium]|nr:DUF1653 domain-containing protein [Candidatus Saccharimonadales bacterium]